MQNAIVLLSISIKQFYEKKKKIYFCMCVCMMYSRPRKYNLIHTYHVYAFISNSYIDKFVYNTNNNSHCNKQRQLQKKTTTTEHFKKMFSSTLETTDLKIVFHLNFCISALILSI